MERARAPGKGVLGGNGKGSRALRFGFAWIYLGLFGFIWVCLGLFGFIWVYLGLVGFRVQGSARVYRDYLEEGVVPNSGSLPGILSKPHYHRHRADSLGFRFRV